jgi:hypothetical protein
MLLSLILWFRRSPLVENDSAGVDELDDLPRRRGPEPPDFSITIHDDWSAWGRR